MSKNNKKPFILFRSKAIVFLQFIATAFTIFALIRLNLLATKYLIVAVAVLVLLLLLYGALLLNTRERSFGNRFVKFLSVVLSLSLILGSAVYVVRGDSFIRAITGAKTEAHEVSVVVKEDSNFETLDDVRGLPFSANMLMDKLNIEQAKEILLSESDLDVEIDEYTKYTSLVADIQDGTTYVMLLNEAHRDLILEIDENFSENTRVIHTIKFEKEVELTDFNTNVDKDTFSFFITGIDTYGPVSSVSRSDVNMIMTVNPRQNQILLLSIPRDYHVTLASFGAKDKLTHAGIYGVEESVSTLENLLDMDIDYYIRVNFTSVEQIVNAMGGVDVQSLYDFNAAGHHFNKGPNHLDGSQSLAFVRERYSLPNGDLDRGRHQQALMQGIINKATSPTILTKYNSILSSVSGSLEMSMPDKDLKKLVKNQQDENAAWDIHQYQLSGVGSNSTSTYSMPGSYLYVMEPDYATVDYASQIIHAMENNEIINVE